LKKDTEDITTRLQRLELKKKQGNDLLEKAKKERID